MALSDASSGTLDRRDVKRERHHQETDQPGENRGKEHQRPGCSCRSSSSPPTLERERRTLGGSTRRLRALSREVLAAAAMSMPARHLQATLHFTWVGSIPRNCRALSKLVTTKPSVVKRWTFSTKPTTVARRPRISGPASPAAATPSCRSALAADENAAVRPQPRGESFPPCRCRSSPSSCGCRK